MKKILIIIAFVLPVICAPAANAQTIAPGNKPGGNLDKSLWALQNPSAQYVLISAHRGDWRNAPENSMQSLTNSMAMGADIVELDLGKTSDGQLIIMHDKTIDRTTTGKGKPSNFTLAAIKQFYLKSGNGHKTAHRIPTFDEFLNAAKGKVILDVDKGYEFIDQAIPMLNDRGMLHQVIYNVNDNLPLDTLLKQHPNIPPGLRLMVVVNIERKDASMVISSYRRRPNSIVQVIYPTDTLSILKTVPAIRQSNAVWMNSLWPEHNGGHNDDRAVEQNQPDESWGWLANRGANIIQTDRPQQLLNYLRAKRLHD